MMIPDVSVIKERTEQVVLEQKKNIKTMAEKLAEEKMKEILAAADKGLFKITWRAKMVNDDTFSIHHYCLSLFGDKGYKVGYTTVNDNTCLSSNSWTSWEATTYEFYISWRHE